MQANPELAKKHHPVRPKAAWWNMVRRTQVVMPVSSRKRGEEIQRNNFVRFQLSGKLPIDPSRLEELVAARLSKWVPRLEQDFVSKNGSMFLVFVLFLFLQMFSVASASCHVTHRHTGVL